MSEPKNILFVDDERSVLRSLRRAFMKSGHKLYFADSGELALKILASEPGAIDLVVSDMRMPGMDGYTFLSEVKKRYPEVIRLILSGYVEESYVYKALIEGAAKTYLAKPWKTAELIELVNGLMTVEEALKERKLLKIINTLDCLPTLPEIYFEVMELIEADADFDKIVKVIEKDPAISAKVLQVANSAFFKSGTASLKRAAVFIGMMTLKDIVVGSAVFQTLAAPGMGFYVPEKIWEHAVACNGLVCEMHELLHDERIPEELATVGLLHNIGLLVLLKFFPEKINEISELQKQEPDKDLLELEIEVCGIGHPQIGAYLLNWWNMPYPLTEAALYHHTPHLAAANNRETIYLLHVADHLAGRASGVPGIKPLDPEIFNRVEIPGKFRSQCLVAEEAKR